MPLASSVFQARQTEARRQLATGAGDNPPEAELEGEEVPRHYEGESEKGGAVLGVPRYQLVQISHPVDEDS